MSGPPKTPPHLRLVRGNPSKRQINKDEPQPPAGVPPTPKHFDKQAKYWFKRMAEELDAVGVISQLDARALELLVEAYTEYRHHCDTLEIEGYTYRTETQTGGVLMWLIKTLLTSRCVNQPGAGLLPLAPSHQIPHHTHTPFSI
ncbi:phage terminase small subunit P27 family [Cronobacter dublinensis]